MNKHKRNLEPLRAYLGRDEQGLKLLDAIARDITEQRQRIASLEESEAVAVSRASHLYQEAVNVEIEKERLKTDLETERRRLVSSKAQSAADAERIKQLESADEVADEAPVRGVFGSDDQTAKIVSLFKAVRKRYKRIPPADGPRQVFRLEGLIKTYSGDEFMGLGMLVAALALHGLPARVEAERTIKEMGGGWETKHTAKFIHWYGSWFATTELEQRVFGPSGHSGPRRETTPFSLKGTKTVTSD